MQPSASRSFCGDAHARRNCGIGGVDDAGVGAAGFYVCQHLADVASQYSFAAHGVVNAERGERLLRVHSRGHAARIGQRHGANVGQQQILKTFNAADSSIAFGDDEHEAIGQKRDACAGTQQTFRFERVHFFGRGGNEYVRGSALLDLHFERAQPAQIERDGDVRMLRVIEIVHIAERVFQAGGRGDQ